jgi:hypothetical protein
MVVRRQLPPELVSLVHHVHLNESGWWKKAIRRMILATIWMSGRPLNFDQIKSSLAKEFQVKLTDVALQTHIDALCSEGVVGFQSGNGIAIGHNALKEFEIELEKSRDEAEQTKNQFCALIARHCNGLDATFLWEDFNTNFLLPMIRETGANTYRIAIGETGIHTNKYLNKFIDKHEDYADGLRRALLEFFSPRNHSARGYILKYLNVCFYVEAARIPRETLQAVEASQKKKPIIRLFLDTNFLFSVLGLHENPSDLAAATLLNLEESLKDKIDLRLFVIPDTLEEVKRVISSAIYSLTNRGVPSNVAMVALHSSISGLAAKYLDVVKNLSIRITPVEYFQPYIDDLVRILNGKKVEVFGRITSHFHTRQDVVDDILLQRERDQKRPENKRKSYEALQHDMTLWHVVHDSRPRSLESPLEAGDWVVTLDYRFLGFDQFKQRISGGNVPVCLHPTNLVQFLQFWVPISQEVEESILNSMRLPLFFYEFDEQDEVVTMRIIQTISRYEEADDLPVETIRRIFVDKALRAKLADNIPEVEQVKLIKDALLAEHARVMGELGEAKKRAKILNESIEKEAAKAEELEEKLRVEKRAREEMFGKLEALEKRYGVEKQIDSFKISAFYLPATFLSVMIWVIYSNFPQGDPGFRVQVAWVVSILYLALWILWIERKGRIVESISASSSFKRFAHFSKYIYGGLGILWALILAEIFSDYWSYIVSWAQKLKNYIFG